MSMVTMVSSHSVIKHLCPLKYVDDGYCFQYVLYICKGTAG